MYTELQDRFLWFDGESSVDVKQLAKLILQGNNLDGIHPKEYTFDVMQFNKFYENSLEVKYNVDIDNTWNIPEKYINMNIIDYIVEKWDKYTQNCDNDYMVASYNRLMREIDLMFKLNLENLFKAIIYLLDQFDLHKIIWGVGRGSSCASYILFLCGVHLVDPIIFNIDEKEFYKMDINTVSNNGE